MNIKRIFFVIISTGLSLTNVANASPCTGGNEVCFRSAVVELLLEGKARLSRQGGLGPTRPLIPIECKNKSESKVGITPTMTFLEEMVNSNVAKESLIDVKEDRIHQMMEALLRLRFLHQLREIALNPPRITLAATDPLSPDFNKVRLYRMMQNWYIAHDQNETAIELNSANCPLAASENRAQVIRDSEMQFARAMANGDVRKKIEEDMAAIRQEFPILFRDHNSIAYSSLANTILGDSAMEDFHVQLNRLLVTEFYRDSQSGRGGSLESGKRFLAGLNNIIECHPQTFNQSGNCVAEKLFGKFVDDPLFKEEYVQWHQRRVDSIHQEIVSTCQGKNLDLFWTNPEYVELAIMMCPNRESELLSCTQLKIAERDRRQSRRQAAELAATAGVIALALSGKGTPLAFGIIASGGLIYSANNARVANQRVLRLRSHHYAILGDLNQTTAQMDSERRNRNFSAGLAMVDGVFIGAGTALRLGRSLLPASRPINATAAQREAVSREIREIPAEIRANPQTYTEEVFRIYSKHFNGVPESLSRSVAPLMTHNARSIIRNRGNTPISHFEVSIDPLSGKKSVKTFLSHQGRSVQVANRLETLGPGHLRPQGISPHVSIIEEMADGTRILYHSNGRNYRMIRGDRP